jgi:iron-sulfur cluster insertion protein
MSETALVAEQQINVTESAAARVGVLIKMEDRPNMMLRLGVSGGGCSGFQYGISLDDQLNEDDRVFEQHGIRLVIDQTSLDLIGGSVLDYVEDMIGSSFQVKNPGATSTCGCGSSFSM